MHKTQLIRTVQKSRARADRDAGWWRAESYATQDAERRIALASVISAYEDVSAALTKFEDHLIDGEGK